MCRPGWARPAVRAAAAAAILAASVSCAHARSAASSPVSRGTPDRSLGGLFFWSHFNRVNGLAAVSAQDIWAVGSAATGKPLIEHWAGMAWRQVPAASPRGARESLLNGVAAVSSSRAWAVGYYNDGRAIRTLIERWNGRAWTQVTSPSPGGSRGRSALDGVAASGTSGAWAVGYYGPPDRPLIERWNGRAWTLVTSPNPGGRDGGALAAVTTIGKAGAWAAGSVGTRTVDDALIERWTGRAWTQVNSPRPAGSRGSTLTAIAADSAADAWAVGYYFADATVDPAVLTLTERWNGRAWRQVRSPSPGGTAVSSADQSLLQGVCAISPSDAWSAGSYSSGNPLGKILIARWTGRAWKPLAAGR